MTLRGRWTGLFRDFRLLLSVSIKWVSKCTLLYQLIIIIYNGDIRFIFRILTFVEIIYSLFKI